MLITQQSQAGSKQYKNRYLADIQSASLKMARSKYP
jgi:hypothetical protein